jgi:hypothetical protein
MIKPSFQLCDDLERVPFLLQDLMEEWIITWWFGKLKLKIGFLLSKWEFWVVKNERERLICGCKLEFWVVEKQIKSKKDLLKIETNFGLWRMTSSLTHRDLILLWNYCNKNLQHTMDSVLYTNFLTRKRKRRICWRNSISGMCNLGLRQCICCSVEESNLKLSWRLAVLGTLFPVLLVHRIST